MTADHIVPHNRWPAGVPGVHAAANLAPAHGTMGGDQPDNPCPTCRRLCNQERRDGPAPVQRRRRSRDWYA